MTFLFSIGHALEAGTMNKIRSALAELVAVAPDAAIVMRVGAQHEIPAHEVHEGKIVLVKNGAKIPVDSIVVDGTGSIDEASITGESIPVEKVASDQVFAGTISGGDSYGLKRPGSVRTPHWHASFTAWKKPKIPKRKPRRSLTVSLPGTPLP